MRKLGIALMLLGLLALLHVSYWVLWGVLSTLAFGDELLRALEDVAPILTFVFGTAAFLTGLFLASRRQR